jgi:hypothetical protein
LASTVPTWAISLLEFFTFLDILTELGDDRGLTALSMPRLTGWGWRRR